MLGPLRATCAAAGRNGGGGARLPRHRIRGGVDPGGAPRAFLSSGTWSLLGTEVDAPIITRDRGS